MHASGKDSMPVAIQICSGAEWRAFKDVWRLNPQALMSYPYGEYCLQNQRGLPCLFYSSGPTKTRSAGACQYVIDHWSPSSVVVLGTCGAVAAELKVGDIILAEKTVQYDCIDRMGEQGNGFYTPMETTIDHSWLDLGAIQNQVQKATIGTADQDLCADQLEFLRQAGIRVVDWESGAIAKICELNALPCVILRGVSDCFGEEQREDYYNNTPQVMARLLALLPALLDLLKLQN